VSGNLRIWNQRSSDRRHSYQEVGAEVDAETSNEAGGSLQWDFLFNVKVKAVEVVCFDQSF
jgi:hypothetical protein